VKQRPPEPPRRGSVSADEILPAAVLRERFGWGQRSLPEAERRGLRTVTFGRWKYVLGKHLLSFFEALGNEPAAVEGNGEGNDGT